MIGANDRVSWTANDGHPPTVRVRASSWGRLFDCAYSWEGTALLGMASPSGMPAHLGTCIHTATAAFDEGRAPGATPISLIDAVEVFCQALDNPTREVDFSRDTLTMREARAIGAQLVTAYCRDISPRYTFAAVELKLNPLRVAIDRVVIELTGSLDRSRLVDVGNREGSITADLKSGAAVIEQGRASIKGRSAQLGAYELLGEAATGIPSHGAQIIALPTSGRPVPMVSRVWDAKTTMVGTDTAPGFLEIAAGMFGSGLFPPNPSSRLCSPKFCPRFARCHYREPVDAE
jgi:hypothetical protein